MELYDYCHPLPDHDHPNHNNLPNNKHISPVATLTTLMDDVTIARRNRRKLECMIVIDDLVLGCGVADALPRILLDVDVRLLDVPVFVEKVLGERERKVFGRFDAVLFGQQVDGVLLRVGRNDIRVVTWPNGTNKGNGRKKNRQCFVCHAHFPIKMDGFDGGCAISVSAELSAFCLAA